jgi:pimeloyl-ACP methyl ester carboxylesterase
LCAAGQPVRTGDAPTILLPLLAREDVAFQDTWHVAGLRGTGSLDFTAQDVLVPPERVAALGLVCTSARFGDPPPWLERAATVRAGGAEAVADAVVGRWFSDRFAAEHPSTVEDMRAMIAATPAEGYAACCEAIAGWDVTDGLAGIAAPTLVVSGAEDPATPPEHGRVLAEGIPGARLEIVDDAAHLASFQRPEIVTPLIRELVKGAL